jgi:hypothetical protein
MSEDLKKLKPVPDGADANIVSNLLLSQPELVGKYDDWQIALAHRDWSISEDHPDETKIVDWIPEFSAENIIRYINIRNGDLRRAIAELEKYHLEQRKTIARLQKELKEADDAKRL